jgi:hypothetical protein
MNKEFKYNLIDGFEYASNGIVKKSYCLTIKAPKMKVACYTAILEREFFKAMENVPKNEQQDKNSKSDALKASDYTMLLSAYGDIQKCYDALTKILIDGRFENAVCKIDDLEKMTESLIEELSLTDIKNVLGEYYRNFLLTSLQI